MTWYIRISSSHHHCGVTTVVHIIAPRRTDLEMMWRVRRLALHHYCGVITVVHIIAPRLEGDFENNDDVYDALDNHDADPTRGRPAEDESNNKAVAMKKLHVPPDSERKDRTPEDMADEARALAARVSS